MKNRILKAVRWLLAGLLCGALTIISFQIEYNTPRHDHCRGYLQNEFRRMCSHGYSTGRILRGRKSPDHRPYGTDRLHKDLRYRDPEAESKIRRRHACRLVFEKSPSGQYTERVHHP